MDEKEEYLKDNETSRAELNGALDEYALCFAEYEKSRLFTETNGGNSKPHYQEHLDKVNSLLDILYARLYLAECPF